jgi:predicted transcriptional regulator
MTRDIRRLPEAERREIAYQLRDEDVQLAEGTTEPRRLDHMFSVRLDPDLAARIRDLASVRAVTVSELLREAASLLLENQEAPQRTVVEHLVAHRGSRPTVYVTDVLISSGNHPERAPEAEASFSGT